MEPRPAFSVTARPQSVAMAVSGEYTLGHSVQRVTAFPLTDFAFGTRIVENANKH